MPIRAGGEPEGEAREWERQRRVERRRPPPTAPPRAQPEPAAQPVPTPTPQRREPPPSPTVTPTREFDFKFWEPQAPTTPGRRRRRLRLAPTAPFVPETEPTEVPAPREFDPAVAEWREFIQFTEWDDSLTDSVSGLPYDPVADAAEFLSPVSYMPQTGRQEDLLDAGMNNFWVYKNLEEHLRQYEEFDPEAIEQLNKEVIPGVRNSPTAIASAGTLNPLKALWRAREEIQKAHPDNYTQFLASDAGRAELFNNALMMMYTPPKAEWSLITPGESAGEAIDQNMADVPFLKPAIVNTVKTVGDPVFIAAVTAFPPAGLAAKAKLGLSLAGGMAIGEEVAEEVGLPGIVGALPGGLLGAGAPGFTRAAMRAALRRARHLPVAGEPATQVLVESGQLAADLGELGEMVGARRVYYRGASTNQEAALGEGAFLTTSAKDAEVYAATNVRMHGGKPTVQVFTAEEGAVTAMPAEEGLAAARGGARVVNPEGVRPLVPGELPFPKLGGVPPAAAGRTVAQEARPAQVARDFAIDKDIVRFLDTPITQLTDGELATLHLQGEAWLFSGSPRIHSSGDRLMNLTIPELTRRGLGVKMDELRALAAAAPAPSRPVAGAVGPPGRQFPARAGGATGPSIEGFRTKIRAHIERPEARDFLRLIAGKVADYVPMGVGKRIQEVVNRLAVADEPALKAAFGWHFQLAEDQAARWMTLAPFRGARVPFIENEIGQFWVPKTAPVSTGLPARALTRFESTGVGNLFRRGEGEWIAGGDVAESVLRGEQTYLNRLTQEQIDWFTRAGAAMEPYISFAEQATGMTVRKRDVWWPRFAVDPERKLYNVTAGTRRGKPPALFERVFEVQQEAIAQHGIKYRPGLLDQMEGAVEGMQRLTRDSLMARYLREEGILRFGKPRLAETYGTDLGPMVRGVMNKAHFREIQNIIGPGTTNPAITVPQKINGIARLVLTGTLDTGWGAIQLITLAASPAGPKGWAEAMARGFYNALVEPKQFYRYAASSKGMQEYALYGGDMGFTSELMEAARIGGVGLPRIPGVSPIIDVATFPARAFINRMMTGFDASLAYGRGLAYEAMAEVATKPGLLEKVAGARALSGAALHEEKFRLARFTDTLIGQPKLGGVITARQHQGESAFVWFATRYTRSMLGTMSYMFGKGYTPAQARVTMSKMLLGGMSIASGLIAAHGAATGKSKDEIFEDITTALNPASGKKFMSMKVGTDWFGLGGTYRAGFALVGQMADKDNWDFESWDEATLNNPIVRGWRSRTAPVTGRLIDFLTGEDFLGYSVDYGEFVDDPRKLGDYAINNFAPITIDALLQGGGDWQRRTPRFIAEFFGLRTSPETAWEALEPVMNRVSQYTFGTPWSGLEHNMPAQDFVKNHPDVVAVTEGRVRPIRDRPRERLWKKYREGRGGISDKTATSKEKLEDSFTSGRMDGSDYREKYGDIQSAEFYELMGFREGLGVEFGEREAPPGTVDAALDAYFQVDLDDYRDKETHVPDWEAFFADRDAALARVPEESQPLVEQWLRRRETPLRRHFRTRFESVIEPSGYFRMREDVAVTLGVSLDDLETFVIRDLQKGDRRAAPADVSRLTDQLLNKLIKDVYGEDAPSIATIRKRLREENPALDAELFYQGFATTVRSEDAIEHIKRYQQMWPDMGYFLPPLASDVKERLKREERESQ